MGKNILPHYQHRESQRKLTGHCQWAEDVFHVSRSTNKRPGVCLGVTRLIFAVNYFFTEVGNRQKHAPIRALKANALLRKGAPALCLQAQGHKRDIPSFKPPWFMCSHISGMKANRSQKNSNAFVINGLAWQQQGGWRKAPSWKNIACMLMGRKGRCSIGKQGRWGLTKPRNYSNGKVASCCLQWMLKCFSSDQQHWNTPKALINILAISNHVSTS